MPLGIEHAYDLGMKRPRYSETKLRELGQQRIELLRQLDELEVLLNPMIAAACAKLVSQASICEWTGYRPGSRDKIRRIARENGVEALTSDERASHARRVRAEAGAA